MSAYIGGPEPALPPTRSYTAEEASALRVIFPNTGATGGPAQYASGTYWPDELERRADEFERRIPKLRLAAKALRREIANDPRCTS
jgi:hypothetical protein